MSASVRPCVIWSGALPPWPERAAALGGAGAAGRQLSPGSFGMRRRKARSDFWWCSL
jgi:hypothetical protein